MVETKSTWQAPPYKLRRSSRATRARFRITAKKGLEIILPRFAYVDDVENLLYQHRQWIEKQFAKLALPCADHNPDVFTLPSRITLPSINSTWQIETIACLGKAKLIERPGQTLVLLHDYDHAPEAHIPLLTQWFRNKANDILPNWLTSVSRECQLPFNKVSIRAQSARWGSCSEERSITLNYKLLFFPPAVVRYIMIHELSHTVHLNHSNAFWQLVESLDPQYRRHEAILKKEREFIPTWLW